ncbi:hypothetical protein F4782DRAFT_550357 [Xylaria castorea]|nr:hypothetical protein F4782DRAFT_550357 [Xylaria castorea]
MTIARGPESQETTAEIETSPPSYEDTCVEPMPGTYPLPQQPGPTTSGNSYRENEQHRSILFLFCPDPSDISLNQDWVAVLTVKCRDVPRLMREGFFWDSANVIREEGYVDQDFTYAYCRQGRKRWAGTRHYFLKDLQQPLRWVATIEIFALNLRTLYQFDLNRLSREKTQSAAAINESGHHIYNWQCGCPGVWYNVVYDDTPMEGWWPWPRKN